jgi:hypothetical protein
MTQYEIKTNRMWGPSNWLPEPWHGLLTVLYQIMIYACAAVASQDSTVSIVTALQAGQPRTWGAIPHKDMDFPVLQNIQTVSGGPPILLLNW